MIRLAGLVPGRDIEVRALGVRPGEKLEEQLAHGPLEASTHPKINVAKAPFPGPVTLFDLVGQLSKLTASGKTEELKSLLVTAANHIWPANETVDLADSMGVEQWA